MEILKITEQEDGSAILEVDLTTEEVKLLIEKGLVTILKDYTNSETIKHKGGFW